MRITLLRHAEPEVTADALPEAWPLTCAGREAARRLRLPQDARVVASPERKAVETLALALGVADVPVDPRFAEVRRPAEPVAPGFRTVRQAWVQGAHDGRHDGWETTAEAARRFDDGVRDRAGGHDLVVATHGMVLTAWLVSVGQVAAGAPAAAFWDALALPDVVTVDLGP
ncbi:histidine phosphatase family protein [Isoptericola sp. NPDC057191]|uniref:histidine phosphatase family protein n=1 Tax=Isoptericola sp. NPDC057191 TaxID=3346041 RepID=UPI00363E2BFC